MSASCPVSNREVARRVQGFCLGAMHAVDERPRIQGSIWCGVPPDTGWQEGQLVGDLPVHQRGDEAAQRDQQEGLNVGSLCRIVLRSAGCSASNRSRGRPRQCRRRRRGSGCRWSGASSDSSNRRVASDGCPRSLDPGRHGADRRDLLLPSRC